MRTVLAALFLLVCGGARADDALDRADLIHNYIKVAAAARAAPIACPGLTINPLMFTGFLVRASMSGWLEELDQIDPEQMDWEVARRIDALKSGRGKCAEIEAQIFEDPMHGLKIRMFIRSKQ